MKGLAQGLAQGARQAREEDARNLVANNVPVEVIAKSLNMTVEEINQLIAK